MYSLIISKPVEYQAGYGFELNLAINVKLESRFELWELYPVIRFGSESELWIKVAIRVLDLLPEFGKSMVVHFYPLHGKENLEMRINQMIQVEYVFEVSNISKPHRILRIQTLYAYACQKVIQTALQHS